MITSSRYRDKLIFIKKIFFLYWGVFSMTIFKRNPTKSEQSQHLIFENKKLKSQLSAIIKGLPGSIYYKDPQGVYLGANDHAWQMIGLSSEDEIIGKTDFDLFSVAEAKQFRINDLEVMHTKQEVVREEVVLSSEGKTLVQLSTKKALIAKDGSVLGILSNTIDITLFKKLEIELLEAKEKAELENQTKTNFIRNIEHDIRTPFSGIYGLTEYLYSKETDPNKKEMLEEIKNSAKELLDYCNGILDLSNIDSNMHAIIEKPFNLRDLINGVIKIETPAAHLKMLVITSQIDDELPVILIGDPQRLQRILINLLSNAIKFTNTGHVKLMVVVGKWIDNRHTIIRFILEDTGIGIPLDQQDRIYEKFYRLDPTNRGIYKGSGLGLYVVKQSLAEIGGDIQLKSMGGVGSTFICDVPFKLPLL